MFIFARRRVGMSINDQLLLFLTQAVNGLQLGSIYALIALGYSMVYGIIMLLNFAHGDIIMVGGYIALLTVTKYKMPAAFGVVFAILGCIIVSVIIERLAYKPLRKAPKISLLITAIGVSFFLENFAQLLFTANGKSFPSSLFLPDGNVYLAHVPISLTALITVAVSIISMIALVFLVHKTRLGKAMRATSEDTEAAQLMGVNIDKVISFTFVVGAALAGVGSILYCCRYPLVNPTMGYLLGMKAFVAAVLGGIGSIPGAVLGGFLIGFAEVFVSAAGLSTWTDAIVFAILILVMTISPSGLLGRRIVEKV
jgi:branched-chain amino acid transport system permease protein